jgi:Zn-dependent protease
MLDLLANPVFLVVWVISLLLAITFHEAAHGFMADYLGDPTPRSQGRLSLNPLSHIDAFGTVVMPLLLLFATGGRFVFGWAKPVPFDPYNLDNPRRDTALISLAGPATNIVLAIIASLVSRFLLPSFYAPALYPFISINVVLAIFNLIPVHPLDGSKILLGLLPLELAAEWQVIMRRYGTLILLLLILPLTGVSPLITLIGPVVEAVLRLLLP